jgi:alkylresorcinol/alkylpyrone synthase
MKMPSIISIAEVIPPHETRQEQVCELARGLFAESYKDIERLLQAFPNGQIEKRHFVKDMDWYRKDHSFEEKNAAYIELAVKYGKEAIIKCLQDDTFLKKPVPYDEIDAIIYISTTGIATPSIEARIMNLLPFNPHTKRIPIWGLGCAGGAAGLARAADYCIAFPKAKVLVLAVELCSLTFQRNDRSKSNIIGTSLFADGIACALVCGDSSNIDDYRKKTTVPSVLAAQSTLMPDSLDVMGWDIKDEGLYVVFSRDIPHIIEDWLRPNVLEFLTKKKLDLNKIDYFIAHPGGKKVLDAYRKALNIPESMTELASDILRQFGNMSSVTILYVLRKVMTMDVSRGSYGLCTALGPGFSSELLLLRWFE